MRNTIGHMKRTQIQFEEPVFESLRKQAFMERTSIAEIIRRAVGERLIITSPKKRTKKLSSRYFSFIGAGRSTGRGSGTIAKRHDEELARM